MIKENLKAVRETLPGSVRLIAVSKTKPVEDLREAYDAGQRLFGENKALEMRDKHAVLPADIEWHFIGHLQRNKIKYIIPFVSLIHSIDSYELLAAVDREAAKHNRRVDCLLQFHIAQEETKFGLDLDEACAAVEQMRADALQHVRIVGVMGMASNTDNRGQVQIEFHTLFEYFVHLRDTYFVADRSFRELSMGMSGDYELAVAEGSTLVRVGSAIFGARQYNIPVND